MKLDLMIDGIVITPENWQDQAYLKDTIKVGSHPLPYAVAQVEFESNRVSRITITPLTENLRVVTEKFVQDAMADDAAGKKLESATEAVLEGPSK